jgi:hypothetical protein
MDKLKVGLTEVAFLQLLPNLLCLLFVKAVVDHITANKCNAFCKEKLRKKCEYHIWLRIWALLPIVFKVCAQLLGDSFTKQSFCHWVISLKCPPFLKTGSKKMGALLALHQYSLTFEKGGYICRFAKQCKCCWDDLSGILSISTRLSVWILAQ